MQIEGRTHRESQVTMSQRRTPHVTSSNHATLERVGHAASTLQARASDAAHGTQRLVRDHPLASMGIALGGGLVLGALAHRLFEHQQTFGEALADRIGLTHARDRVRKWV
jgi:ElaB/YqjD/DUF883 family membrane-anchored ribosome-binding protein